MDRNLRDATEGRVRCELLDIPGAENVRDIGGYAGSGGKPLNKRRFIRAGGMHALTPGGVGAVRRLGISCIVDLRSTVEAKHMPDTLRDDEGIRYVHIPMLDYIQSSLADGLPRFPASMAEMYTGLLDKSKKEFLEVFRVFADPAHKTILFHCTAGKDRTGLTAMLLGGLAGVSRADLVEDYSHSDKLNGAPIVPGLPKYLFESRPETIEAAIDHLDTHYGGIAAYLAHIGVDDAMRAVLLDKLLGT